MKTIQSFLVFVLKYGFMVLGGYWTLVEILASENIHPPTWLKAPWFVLYVAIACTIIYYLRSFFHTIHIENSDCELSIRPGDILKAKNGTVVVGINDTLSYDEKEIGKTSIHYQLMHSEYKKNIENELTKAQNKLKATSANSIATEEAGDAQAEEVLAKYGELYPVTDKEWDRDFVFIVMSHLEEPQLPLAQQSKVVTVDLPKLREAIEVLFENNGKFVVKNNTLFMPLIGTGAAGAEIEKEKLIKWIACAFCAHRPTHCHEINRLIIKVRWKDYFKLSIRELTQTLDWIAKDCCILKKPLNP